MEHVWINCVTWIIMSNMWNHDMEFSVLGLRRIFIYLPVFCRTSEMERITDQCNHHQGSTTKHSVLSVNVRDYSAYVHLNVPKFQNPNSAFLVLFLYKIYECTNLCRSSRAFSQRRLREHVLEQVSANMLCLKRSKHLTLLSMLTFGFSFVRLTTISTWTSEPPVLGNPPNLIYFTSDTHRQITAGFNIWREGGITSFTK